MGFELGCGKAHRQVSRHTHPNECWVLSVEFVVLERWLNPHLTECEVRTGTKAVPRTEVRATLHRLMAKKTAPKLSHYDSKGRVAMVDVSAKPHTARTARARAFLRMKPATLKAIRTLKSPKGNPLEIAQNRRNCRGQAYFRADTTLSSTAVNARRCACPAMQEWD